MTETVVFLTVAAALMLATLPLIGDSVRRSRAKGAADQVASTLHLARQYAISNTTEYTVGLTGTTVAVTCSGSPCPPSAPTEPSTPIVHGATTSVPSPPIRFGPTGTALQTGTIVVSVFQSILDPGPAPQRTFRIATAAACQGRCLQYDRGDGAGFQNLADHILAGGLQFTYRDAATTAFGTPVSAANLALVQQVDIAVQGQMTWASPDPPFTFLSSVKLRNR